jgi:hypothetical protein
MTDTNDEYRSRLIEAVQSTQVRQPACEMTDAQIEARICDSLGLPRGTVLTDSQLEMLIESHKLQRQTEQGQQP